jgi:hypothetical protein
MPQDKSEDRQLEGMFSKRLQKLYRLMLRTKIKSIAGWWSDNHQDCEAPFNQIWAPRGTEWPG